MLSEPNDIGELERTFVNLTQKIRDLLEDADNSGSDLRADQASETVTWLENLLASIQSWGVDIRNNAGTLRLIENAPIGRRVLSCFKQIDDQLHGFHQLALALQSGSNDHKSHHTETPSDNPCDVRVITGTISSLQDLVKPIRVVLALDHSSGPYADLKSRIDDLTNKYGSQPVSTKPGGALPRFKERDSKTSGYSTIQKHVREMKYLLHTSTLTSNQNFRENSSRSSYLTLPRIQNVLTSARLRNLLERFTWFEEHSWPFIYRHYLRIIATLIDLEWEGWDKFKKLFLTPGRTLFPFATAKKVYRDDNAMPFEYSDLHFLKDQILQATFYMTQFKYKHAVFQEDNDLDTELSWHTCLPITKWTQIRDTEQRLEKSDAAITLRAEFSEFSLEFKSDVDHSFAVNPEPYLLTVKVYDDSSRFKKERSIQTDIKSVAPDHQHLLKSFSSFAYRNQFYMLLPSAEGDLESLCVGSFPQLQKLALNRFKPKAVLDQCCGIVSALHVLYNKLGLGFSDLKLSQISIFDLKLGEAHSGDMASLSVGQWKLAVLETSTVKNRVESSAAGSNLGATPSMDISRPSAPSHAAETAQTLKRKVTTMGSKAFRTPSLVAPLSFSSLGSMLALVYAFLLGGPARVIEPHTAREQFRDNDYSLLFIEAGLLRVKKDIMDGWQNFREPGRLVLGTWKSQIVGLILQLISNDNVSSLDFGGIAEQLSALSKRATNYDQLWQYPEDLSSATRLAGLNPIHLPSSQRNKTWTANVARQKPSNTASLTYTSSFLDLQRITADASFTFLDVVELFSAIEMNSRWAAFISETQVKVYDLLRLIRAPRMGKSEQRGSQRLMTRKRVPSPCIIPCSEGDYKLVTVRLANSFIALLRRHIENTSHILEIRELRWSEDDSTVKSTLHAPMHTTVDCIGMQFSSRGTLALIFSKCIRLFFLSDVPQKLSEVRERPKEVVITESVGSFRNARFSEDGLYLCTWHNTIGDGNHYWCVWSLDLVNYGAYVHHRRKYPRKEIMTDEQQGHQYLQESLIIPTLNDTSGIPEFYVIDEQGQTWIITSDGDETLKKGQKYHGNAAFGISLPQKGVLMLSESTAKTGVDIDTIARYTEPNKMGRSGLDVKYDRQCWTIASDAAICSVVRLTTTSGDMVVVSQKDGSMTFAYAT